MSLVIGGSVFPHKRIHKVRWIAPDHQTENQIDQIYIRCTFPRSLQDIRNKLGADVGSNHHLLTSQIRLTFKNYQTIDTKPCHKYNTDLLGDQNIKQTISNYPTVTRHSQLYLMTKPYAVVQQCEHRMNMWKDTCDNVIGKRRGNTMNGSA